MLRINEIRTKGCSAPNATRTYPSHPRSLMSSAREEWGAVGEGASSLNNVESEIVNVESELSGDFGMYCVLRVLGGGALF